MSETSILSPLTPNRRGVPEAYDPLRTCPPEYRGKYEKMAQRATAGSLAAMVKLHCLSCVCWQSAEVKRCELTHCPLWPRSQRGRAR